MVNDTEPTSPYMTYIRKRPAHELAFQKCDSAYEYNNHVIKIKNQSDRKMGYAYVDILLKKRKYYTKAFDKEKNNS